MKKQRQPYYNAEKNYHVDDTTEIGYINKNGCLNVAHIQDIKFKHEGGDAKIIRADGRDLLLQQDYSQDWIILYKCGVLIEFPDNMNIGEATAFFAASKKTGVHKTFNVYQGSVLFLENGDLVVGVERQPQKFIERFKEGLTCVDAKFDEGYIRELGSDTSAMLPEGTTNLAMMAKKGNFRQNIWRATKNFASSIKETIKNRKSINKEYNFYKNVIKQVKKNHAVFKGDR